MKLVDPIGADPRYNYVNVRRLNKHWKNSNMNKLAIQVEPRRGRKAKRKARS